MLVNEATQRPSWMRPGTRVQLSEAGKAAGLKVGAGVITTVYLLSDEYIEVRRDGKKRAGTWASRFWEPVSGGAPREDR